MDKVAMLALAGWLYGAGPVAAQELPAEPAIVVTGRVREADPAAAIRRVTRLPVGGQEARWNDPVCVRTIGLDAGNAERVVARIAAVAQGAGVPVGVAGCTPNIVVTFTDDGAKLATAVLGRRPQMRRLLEPAERAALTGGTAPVRWWYATRTEGADGRQLQTGIPGLAAVNDVPSNDHSPTLASYHSSLVDTKLRISLESVAVIVDVPRASGVRLTALADYVAFVALARVRMDRRPEADGSVLALFDDATDRARQTGLTAWDRVYLAALYAVPVNRPASVQRAMMAGRMRRTTATDQ